MDSQACLCRGRRVHEFDMGGEAAEVPDIEGRQAHELAETGPLLGPRPQRQQMPVERSVFAARRRFPLQPFPVGGHRPAPTAAHTYTKVRDAGLMSCGRSVGLPSRSAGGVGGGPLGVKGLCRAAPAASASAEAGPHPTSPASGGGGFRRLSAWVPVNDLWYYLYQRCRVEPHLSAPPRSASRPSPHPE